MEADRLKLEWLPGRYAVCRLDASAAVPDWALARAAPGNGRSLLCITRTDRELSIVIDEQLLPQEPSFKTKTQCGFVALRIAGTLDFSAVGILAKLTTALASAQIPVFAMSTFDTDILLVKDTDAHRAHKALQMVADIDAPPR